MRDISSPRGDNPSEGPVCPDGLLIDMHRMVREAAEPAAPGEGVKAAIGRAARRLGLRYSRARAHWYREARSVPADEWIAAQQARLRLRRERAERLRAELAALETEHGITAQALLGGVPLDRGPLA